MKAVAAASLLLLAACSDGQAQGDAAAAPATDNRIDCRIGAAEQFERFCSAEAADGSDGRILTIRKPDGGFRRLLVTGDGRGVVAADGAERANVTILGDDRIEVEIGGDRFRLPATVRGR